MKTLVVGAMLSELEIILNNLEQKQKLDLTKEAYQGKFFGHDIYLLITGIGKVNAALGLTEFLVKHKVDKIINLGLAGSSNDLKINEFVYVSKAAYLDFDLTVFGYQQFEVPNQEIYLYSDISNLVKKSVATLYTSDQFQTAELAVNKPYLADMEGAAYFHVAKQFKTPIMAYKLISDYLGQKDQMKVYFDNENISSGLRIFNFLKENRKVLL